MLRIRLQRTGKKHEPHYRVVVLEKTEAAKSGRVLEVVGHYHPHLKDDNLVVKQDRVKYWIGVGAQPTQTVASLLKKSKII